MGNIEYRVRQYHKINKFIINNEFLSYLLTNKT
jgi:hypothetical protein